MATRFRRTDRQVYRLIAGEHLLIDLHSKAATPFFAITASAVPLWQALESWRTEDELAETLRARYGIEAEQARGDVRDFLEQLGEIGALAREEEMS
jgi:hypothetical protein